MCIADNNYPLSEFNSTLRNKLEIDALGSLQKLQMLVNNETRPSSLLTTTPQDLLVETISHLENQMACSLVMNSVSEYKYWLSLYVRKLTDEGALPKLNELTDDLLGPPHISSYNEGSARGTILGWNPTILGIPKRQLLKDLLPVMSKNRALQRLVTRLSDSLEQIQAREKRTDFDE